MARAASHEPGRFITDLDRLPESLRSPSALDRADSLPARMARLVRAWPHRDLIAQMDFVPVISAAQKRRRLVASLDGQDPQGRRGVQASLPVPGRDDPTQTSPIAFLLANAMLLTGFDAPVEQVLYLDRKIREAELLQAVARVNRTAAKQAGRVLRRLCRGRRASEGRFGRVCRQGRAASTSRG